MTTTTSSYKNEKVALDRLRVRQNLCLVLYTMSPGILYYYYYYYYYSYRRSRNGNASSTGRPHAAPPAVAVAATSLLVPATCLLVAACGCDCWVSADVEKAVIDPGSPNPGSML